MGGFFGVASKNDAVLDTFFGVDYHSHLGTRRAGMAAMDAELGMQRKIHKIDANMKKVPVYQTVYRNRIMQYKIT